ncbi:MAG: peptidoglycan bridge formation glycyltransferase FemA/FemB family protein [Bacilli bacterium]|nr:peptidoglycan bridge formation glycyltransferase FemA/FemB family protein [Bacilli bacterium]
MYYFKKVRAQEVNNFAIKNGIFRQTSAWAKMKKRYFKTLSFLGYDNNNNVVFSCLLLRFYIPLTPFSICYAPRGFISDYNNENLTKEFTNFYYKYMKKHLILYTIFDPEIVKKTNFENDKNGEAIVSIFERLGYKLNDNKNYRHMQNNNNYRLLIDYNSGNVLDDTFNKLAKKLQYDINLGSTRGITVEKYDGHAYLKDPNLFEEFYKLILETGRRSNFTEKLLSKEKYQKMIYAMHEYGHLYFAKYNYEIDRANINELINKTSEEIKRLEANSTRKSLNKIKELSENLRSYKERLDSIKEHQDNPYVAVSFFIMMGNQAYYMFGGNESKLRFTKPTSLLLWEMISDTIKSGAEVFNTGGSLAFDNPNLKEDSMYRVYEFKSGMNGELVDFYGDFCLINSKLAYKILEMKFKLLKRINNRY